MKRQISKRELRQIRRAVEALPGRYDTGEIIPISIALPDPCDADTRAYALQLIRGLETVKCRANISFILSFSRHIVSEKRYEVLPEIPLATPCIRVHPYRGHKYASGYERIRQSLKDFWSSLWLRSAKADYATT